MSAEKIVKRLLEDDDESIDPKGFVLDPPTTSIKEISIVGRRWFRKGYGGTYHTATIAVDGKPVGKTPYQYGYGDQYLETGWQWLEENGYVPKRAQGNGGSTSPWRAAQDLGIKLDYYAIDVKRQRDL
jgi:hypothetical protein